jgi:hypothetical protein
MSDLKEYLKKEWKYCNHTKYQHYFEDWFNKLTETQLLYFKCYSIGLKTPY